ncbi:MAG: type III-B CRISPR module RAMP protein Cmr6 [Verrucomicrobia bacterium]|nr:type III-B CRISPR module RAMP protein Cmr6 [Verrucomicrobiota bacterium]
MTPHYGAYYAGKGPPADWLSPNPIPFLTVAPDQLFQFVLAPASRAAQLDCTTAAQWLTDALAWLGAGAKTAVGYGRFVRADIPSEPAGEPGGSPPAATPSRGPRFKPGQRVTTRRVDDPKARGRVWFEAEDGFGGVVTAGPPPTVEVGQPFELEVASVNQGLGYNFRVPRLVTPPAKPKSKRRRL